MALAIGDRAPKFRLPSTDGSEFSLEKLEGRACILYFYPKDFTAICTKEACAFRDQFAHLRDLEVPVFGINQEPIETHLRFKKEYKLPFDLLADVGGEVTKAYKARVPILGLTKRITYLLDRDHRIAAAHEEMLGHESHVNEVIEALENVL